MQQFVVEVGAEAEREVLEQVLGRRQEVEALVNVRRKEENKSGVEL
jgi:hypothetical protein